MSYPSELTAALEAGAFAVRGLIRFNFGTGTYGVTNASHPIEYGGLTFVPNALLQVADPAMGMGTAAQNLTITLPESADFGLTPDILATIEDQDYKGRKVIVYDAYFSVDGALLHVEPIYEGLLDYIDHQIEDGQMSIVGHVITSAIDNHRDGYRTASHEDQQLVSAGDRFFEHAAKAGIETFPITLD